MKKNLILSFCFLGTFFTANAQLKIHSNGNMSLQNPDTMALSPVSLNCNGNSSYYIDYEGDMSGIRSVVNKEEGSCHAGYFNSSCDMNSTAISGTASTSSDLMLTHRSIGVKGHASTTGSAYSYGVAGTFTGNLGAGVYGSSSSSISYPSGFPTGRYAGYFVGTTKVVGDFYATGSINGTLISNSSSSPGLLSVMPLSTDRGEITGQLSGLNAHTYHLQTPEKTHSAPDSGNRGESSVEDDEVIVTDEPESDLIEEQIYSKMHYALSADELEEVFPDLVYTDKDGGKAINYVEMVPLLVQCINELNARLSALDGNVGAVVGGDLQSQLPARSQTAAIDDTPSKTKARLYQNTPNPFTVQTEICFSLPDNAPHAYIYIFDMTGKMQKQIPVNPSQQSVTINGYELSAGIYLYSLVVGGQEIDTKRMILSN